MITVRFKTGSFIKPELSVYNDFESIPAGTLVTVPVVQGTFGCVFWIGMFVGRQSQ